MKKMILAAAVMCASVSAFAQYSEQCLVDRVQVRNGRIMETTSSYGDGCKDAMKACRMRINDLRTRGIEDCVRREVTPTPNPYPYPNPNPNPNPNPYPNPNPNPYPGPGSMDARRMLNNGESAILNNRYVTVMGISFNGLYAVRSTDGWNTISNNIRREQLSITNGCSMNICTQENVIDVMSAREVKVVGLSFDERFVTQSTDGWNTLNSNVDRRNLAEKKGCVNSRYVQICVGNQVINSMNRYSTVVAIQLDGRVVLRSSDGWNTISTNVDPSSLVVTR